jgi:DNA invertase Pin-like site-specific DNA recombinase
MRAAIYARDEAENERLREHCWQQDWRIVRDYIDDEPGQRRAFRQLLSDSARRRFDVVVVSSLDQIPHDRTIEVFAHVDRLWREGVLFESCSEPQFRTSGPNGNLMAAIVAWIVRQDGWKFPIAPRRVSPAT